MNAEQHKRYRPFRAAAWAVYLTLASAFSVLVSISVIRSVWAMSPPHAAPSPSLEPVEKCLTQSRQLWASLEARRHALTADTAQPVRRADATWAQFRLEWLKQQREAEGQCVDGSAAREQLKTIFRRLDQLMNLYTTHAVQFAGEVGPTIDALNAAFDEAAR